MKKLGKIILVVCVLSIGCLYYQNGHHAVHSSERVSTQTASVGNGLHLIDSKAELNPDKNSVQLMNPRFYKRLNQKINALLTSSSL